MQGLTVRLPGWCVEAGAVRLSVGAVWQPALVAETIEPLTPAAEGVPSGAVADGIEARGHAGNDVPQYAFTASSVATVPTDQRVQRGRTVGHLELTAMTAGGYRFAVEGTREGRWHCARTTFEHLPQVLDEASPIRAVVRQNLLVTRITAVGLGLHAGDLRHTDEVADREVVTYLLSVQPRN